MLDKHACVTPTTAYSSMMGDEASGLLAGRRARDVRREDRRHQEDRERARECEAGSHACEPCDVCGQLGRITILGSLTCTGTRSLRWSTRIGTARRRGSSSYAFEALRLARTGRCSPAWKDKAMLTRDHLTHSPNLSSSAKSPTGSHVERKIRLHHKVQRPGSLPRKSSLESLRLCKSLWALTFAKQ